MGAPQALQKWLNTIGTELHKGFSTLLTPGRPAEAKEIAKTWLISRLTWVDGALAGKHYLRGDPLAMADAYLFVVAGWPT